MDGNYRSGGQVPMGQPSRGGAVDQSALSRSGDVPPIDPDDWKAQLSSDSRHMFVNMMVERLKKHPPFSGQEGVQKLKKIAERFEENIYSAATSQTDYLGNIALQMLTMETKSPSPRANSGSHSMQNKNISGAGVQNSSASLESALGVTQGGSNVNSVVQNPPVGNSIGLGMQQQQQNPSHFLYQQQLQQQQLMMQQQNLIQTAQIQSSQRAVKNVMQPTMMQSSSLLNSLQPSSNQVAANSLPQNNTLISGQQPVNLVGSQIPSLQINSSSSMFQNQHLMQSQQMKQYLYQRQMQQMYGQGYTMSPIPSPQVLQPQMYQQNMPFIVQSPSTLLVNSTGIIGYSNAAGSAQSLAIGTPGKLTSPLLKEFTSMDIGVHGNSNSSERSNTVVEQLSKRLQNLMYTEEIDLKQKRNSFMSGRRLGADEDMVMS